MSQPTRKLPILMTLYERYLDDRNLEVFAEDIDRRYSTATLQRLAEAADRYRRRAAVLALGLLGDYESNHVMGSALVDQDRGVRLLAESGIRAIWQRAGNYHQRRRLDQVIHLNETAQHAKAITLASELMEQAPWFAEVWNQRAIAYYHIQRFTDSIRDCRQTLEINPYHFGAAAGMGQCYLNLEDPISALECFRRALRLNPNLERVRAQVIQLQKQLKDQ